MIERNDGKLTDEQVAAMSDEEISARMDEFRTRLSDLRHKQEILLEVLAMSFAFLLPMMLCVGILSTFRIAGPVYRFEQYLKEVARGEVSDPCRIRDGDELWDLCDLINEATAPLRHKVAGLEPVPAAEEPRERVPLEEPAAPLSRAH